MNITLTPDQLAGLAYGTAKRNSANPEAVPITDEQFAEDLLGVQCGQFATAKADADKATLASNDSLLEVGLEVSAASLEKQAVVIAAARAELAKP